MTCELNKKTPGVLGTHLLDATYQNHINSSVSRVLAPSQDWSGLECGYILISRKLTFIL